ncbi:cyclophane-forming radical SAM/SPASM peptide maturase GrrM/OscB [Halomicronema sp. CCY15110]|uniref:cyclophane-forming radical SAM/SPASM peptide maturase GrrM/OscB n=1 Tax=Halomicronema sp. CCY15110 TaxID=2767773 RepID=UPI00194DB00A|nr:cyclophane-forming radical SAM/SPASM peptide maturase GrrM/OscB [Halomicronema sp. CCY15110]
MTSVYPAPSPQPDVASVDPFQFGPIELVVIQPTSFCNLNCDYCYLPHRQQRHRLSLDLLEPIFKRLFTSQFLRSNFSICWHAGEPLAAGLAFYEAAFAQIEQLAEIYKPEGIGFNHSIQTNGLLLNQDWCDLFKRYRVHVGVSIDGPDFLHDAHRKTRTGLGSHAGALKGIELLQKYDIPLSTITVLTADSLDYPDEIFDFFMEHGITNVGFNMEETEGIHTRSSLTGVGVEARYRAFLQQFWQRVAEAGSPIQVREFESICSLVYTNTRLHNTDMNHPFRIVSIDHQGNFATFDPELLAMPSDHYGDFALGNVVDQSFEEACQTPKFQRMYQEMQQGVALCQQTCEYFGVCGGGAGSNKYWENGTFASAETQACRYRIKAVTDIALAALEDSLDSDTG